MILSVRTTSELPFGVDMLAVERLEALVGIGGGVKRVECAVSWVAPLLRLVSCDWML